MKNTHVISTFNDTDANFEILKKKIPKRITQKFKKVVLPVGSIPNQHV